MDTICRCLRHRLHHRFTDDDEHDPYSATRGLFFSHVGWIFYKPQYTKIDLVDRADLDRDPVLTYCAYVMQSCVSSIGISKVNGFAEKPTAEITRAPAPLIAWHCTFLINSLAHWDGLQPFSDENTSRTNLVRFRPSCSLGAPHESRCTTLTCPGADPRPPDLRRRQPQLRECLPTSVPAPSYSQRQLDPDIGHFLAPGSCGTALQHAFPHDFRSGPSVLDWDPSKWIILALHRVGLTTGLRRARELDIADARSYMQQKEKQTMHHGSEAVTLPADGAGAIRGTWDGPTWDVEQVRAYVRAHGAACVVVVDGFAVDVTAYMREHPGGSMLLRKYAVRVGELQGSEEGEEGEWTRATWAFRGGLNNHSQAARKRMAELRIAQIAMAM
ncbi:hypothetical protein EVG20_g6608 [Dentipellis fragilis]|uniref:Cytochrome b5 heme-binding domain-containing protein n=1 Tax=Dentipellis fragilis TaxID=205917 RepID=A0A4Y9YJX6_9AGAM|nr:hypothetical protein EVG20_g6608 [Dentipellis fragilis]